MKPKSLYSILLSTLLTMSASLSIAGDGGSDTGAGHVIGSTSVTPYEITSLILRSKEAAKYVIRGYEKLNFVGVSAQELQDLQNKLYNGPKTFSDALKEAKLKPIDQGACIDKDGTEVEASAINAPDLCFDPVMISKRVNSDNVQVEVLALVLHEVSHMIGTTEDEAKTLQQMIRDHSMKDPIDKIPDNVQSNLKRMNDALEPHIQVKENSKTNPALITEIMHNKIFLSATITNLLNDVSYLKNDVPTFATNGFSILTKNDEIKLTVAWYKTVNSLTFSFPGEPTKHILAIYHDKQMISISDFAKCLYTPKKADLEIYNSIILPFKKFSIHKINPGDNKTFILENREIEKILKEVYVSINAK